MSVHCTFSFYYPKDRLIGALRVLESCCTPFAPESATARRFVLSGEVATVTSQPVIAHYVGPDGYYEPMGEYEDGWFKGSVVDLEPVPDRADSVSIMYTTTLMLRVPVLPGRQAEWHRESESRGEFTVGVMITTDGDYSAIRLTSPDSRMNEYFLHSRPVRVHALEFAHATGALLALEDSEGPYYELVEEPTWSGGHEPDSSWRLTTALRTFGALPGAG